MIIYFSGNTITKSGETVLLYGDGLDEIKSISVSRLCNKKVTDKPGYITVITPAAIPTSEQLAGASEAVFGKDSINVKLIQQNNQSVKFVIPESLEMGVYSVIVETADSKEILYVNAPAIKWTQGDNGESASPSGWLRICGEKLSIDGGETSVVFEKDGKLIPMEVSKVYDAYSVEVKIPADFETGEYKVYLTNGFGGDTAWSMPEIAKIAYPEVMPEKIFNVRDFGAVGTGLVDDTDAVKAALAAAGENGGGVVYFPRGRYQITDPIDIPDYTTIRGESKNKTQVFWFPFKYDFNKLPEYFISAESNVIFEDIEFRGTRAYVFMDLGKNTPNPKNITLRRLIINFNPYSGIEFAPAQKHYMDAMNEIDGTVTYFTRPGRGSALIFFAGDNISIYDNDIYSPQVTFAPQVQDSTKWGSQSRPKTNFLFKNNIIRSRYDEWSFFGYSRHAIIEDNIFDGNTVGSAGQGMYFARNKMINTMFRDREAYTTDMSYSAIIRANAKFEGNKVIFPEGTRLHIDRTENPALYIANGKGAGQARAVVKAEENIVTLDSPFACEPDETSELNYGGTIRTDFYLIENYINNAGHIQFFVDQCLSVFDGNKVDHAGGILTFSWIEGNTKTGIYFITVLNNSCIGGNHFHYYGAPAPEDSDCEKVDMWSGYTTVGVRIKGNVITSHAIHFKRNELTDNAMFRFFGDGYVDNLIIENNKVYDSEYGINVECHTSTSYIRNNDITGNVSNPLTVIYDADDETKILIENY
ncbi:MAG: hypothetical protein E7672_02750 [Ruminococcaceae bacterium]|nr:hypothetical protein [Oscillospiraceae bacterium]